MQMPRLLRSSTCDIRLRAPAWSKRITPGYNMYTHTHTYTRTHKPQHLGGGGDSTAAIRRRTDARRRRGQIGSNSDNESQRVKSSRPLLEDPAAQHQHQPARGAVFAAASCSDEPRRRNTTVHVCAERRLRSHQIINWSHVVGEGGVEGGVCNQLLDSLFGSGRRESCKVDK